MNKLLHLAAALTYQSDDGNVGGRVTRDHRHQDGLADSRAGKDSHTLAAATGQKCVNSPNAEIQLARHALAHVSGRRRVAYRIGAVADGQWRPVVDRFALRVNNTAKPLGGRRNGRLRFSDFGLAAEADAIERAER